MLGWLNVTKIRKEEKDSEFPSNLLSPLRGCSISTTEQDDVSHSRFRALFTDDEAGPAAWPAGWRDTNLLNPIPGPVVGGLHMIVDMDGVTEDIKAFQDSIALDEATDAFEELMGMSLKRAIRPLSGELAVVVHELPSLKRETDIGAIAFIGVGEPDEAERLLKKIKGALEDLGMDVDRDNVEDTTVYRVKAGPLEAAAASYGGHIWLTTEPDMLDDLIEGKVRESFREEPPRGARVSEVLDSDSPFVFFIDIHTLLDEARGLIRKRDRKEFSEWEEMLLIAEGLSITFHRDGAVVDMVTTSLMDGESDVWMRRAMSPILATLGNPLSVVGVPAFIKYRRRAKTTEAIDMMDKIYQGAAAYYATPHFDAFGARLPCQFPASYRVTPIEGTCCSTSGWPGPDRDGNDKCDANPSAWESETWSALNFKIEGEHYFTYSFESSGTLVDAGFTITAHADLDCDGLQSTFQRMGFGDPQANIRECALRGSAAFYVEKETE
jgi:hypothetical protein